MFNPRRSISSLKSQLEVKIPVLTRPSKLHRHARHRSQSCLNQRFVEIVQVENFLDDSLLGDLHLAPSRCQVPILEEMPSVNLKSVGSVIQTPRDFQEFTRQAGLPTHKLERYISAKKYIRHPTESVLQLPKIDWNQHRLRYRTQVIRQTCSNSEYQKLARDHQKCKEFTDQCFSCQQISTSSVRNKNIVDQLQISAWKRHAYDKADSLASGEFSQGTFRTENLVSCFMSLPLRYQLHLFEDQKFDGKTVFYVRLNKQGIWRYILLDNLMPYTTDDICLLSGGFELTLLEKAWAKHNGGYDSLDLIEHIKIGELISDLTGAPSEEFKCNHPKLLFIMGIMLKRNYLLLANNQGCSSKQKRVQDKLRISPYYAYPVSRIEGEFIVIRNHWGAESSSPYYISAEIKLHINEFKQFFDSVVVNKVMTDGHHNSASLRQKKGQYSLVKVIPNRDCKGFLTLNQIHTLQLEEWYSDCRMVLFESSPEGPIFLQEEESADKKTTMEVELLASTEYLLLVETAWLSKQYQTVLSTLTSASLELVKLRYASSNDYLLDERKFRVGQRLKPDQTTANRTNSSSR